MYVCVLLLLLQYLLSKSNLGNFALWKNVQKLLSCQNNPHFKNFRYQIWESNIKEIEMQAHFDISAHRLKKFKDLFSCKLDTNFSLFESKARDD